jgi:hypothetical protein
MILEFEFTRQPIQKLCRVIKFSRDFKCFRVVWNARGIFDVKNIVPKSLQSDDVMDVLPNYARDGHRTHKTHDNDTLAFHKNKKGSTPEAQCPTSSCPNSIFDAEP